MTTDNRHLISDALDDTLVVEAAAGTGKTTELVGRVVRLIETGRAERIDQNRRRHLQREGRRRAEAAAARGAGTCAPGLRVRQRGRGPPRARRPALRGVARQHHPRLLRRPAARASGRGVRGSGLQRAHRRPGRAALRRGICRLDPAAPRRPFGGRAPIAAAPPVRLVARRSGRWPDRSAATGRPRPVAVARSSGGWRRPAGFDRDREVEALVDALKAFAALSSAPISRGDLLFRNTEDLRRASAEIEQLRGRGHDDFDGWEARLCGLAARARDLLQAKGSGAPVQPHGRPAGGAGRA